MRLQLGMVLLAASMCVVSTSSWAACQRLGFSVNDYGKEGPIRDAKKALDAYIKQWTSERGITKYRTGPKTVTCELFIDLGFFDEHTCKAAATFCWDGKSSRPAKVSEKR